VTPLITMRAALQDDKLLAFALPGPERENWRVVLIAAMGEALTDDELAIFRELSGGRDYVPGQRCEELVMSIGRRGGKTEAAGTLAAYVACCCSFPQLVPGEVGTVLIIATDKEMAQICLGRVEAKIRNSPMLKQLIQSVTATAIRLTNGVVIQVRASDYRRVRGTTLLLAIGDEAAHWVSTETGANADSEICAALRPALATTQGMLVLISSPYSKKGEFYNLYQKYYGAGGDPGILVFKATTRKMNPTLAESVITRAYSRDPVSAAAEYGAEFRTDVSNFVDREIIEACIARGMRERMPAKSVGYSAFVDPSGGSSDSFTCAIGHRDSSNSMVYLDCLREIRAPFSPEIAVAELALVLKSYRVTQIVGDHYAGLWPQEAFDRHGIRYETSVLPKSALYQGFLPLLNSATIELVDNPRLVNQLAALERRTARGGKDSIDHPSSGHDDCANAVAGFGVFASNAGTNYHELLKRAFGHGDEEINPRPKRNHPNLDDDALARIKSPPPQIPWDVIQQQQQRMEREAKLVSAILDKAGMK
jgi:hypothetical protein